MFGRQQLGHLRARVRALHGEHREVGALGELDAERRARAWRIHARSLSRVPAFTTMRKKDSRR